MEELLEPSLSPGAMGVRAGWTILSDLIFKSVKGWGTEIGRAPKFGVWISELYFAHEGDSK